MQKQMSWCLEGGKMGGGFFLSWIPFFAFYVWRLALVLLFVPLLHERWGKVRIRRSNFLFFSGA